MSGADQSGNGGQRGPRAGLGARLGGALGRAVGTTLRSLQKGPRERHELDRTTESVETRDDAGRKVVLRRTTVDEMEIER